MFGIIRSLVQQNWCSTAQHATIQAAFIRRLWNYQYLQPPPISGEFNDKLSGPGADSGFLIGGGEA